MIDSYFAKITERLNIVLEKEKASMKKAAVEIVKAIKKGGVVQLFGCGHSHILAEEAFYRAGGLVPIKPIFHEPLMLHERALLSSELERRDDYALSFMENQDIQKKDIMIIISTSGRNPVPIDVAIIAKDKGAFTIGITSVEYSNSQPSRHASGKLLHEVVDLVIDNHSVIGDAILTHEKVAVPFSPTSTVIGATTIHAIFAEVIVQMAENGLRPPIFLSANIEGGDEHNKSMLEKYGERISW
ncbi:SIS domain-containing protein [Bacillus sp. FSL K6-3431]|uniref:SIS domain-containing protein n=1 Tax=Bacillus sp. FSL K6-3431 TaxID=2921500 RepID=UPI0030FD048D